MRSYTFSGALRLNVLAAVAEMVISAVVLLFIYAIILRQLGAEQLGVWSVLTAATAAAGMVNGGMGSALLRFVPIESEQREVSRLISTAVISVAIFQAAVCVAAWLPLEMLVDYLVKDELAIVAITLLPMTLATFWAMQVSGCTLSAMDGLHCARWRALINIISQLLCLILVALLLDQYALGAVAIGFLSREVFRLLCSMLFLSLHPGLIRLFTAGWSRRHFGQLLSYGLRLQMSSLCVFLLEPVSRLLLARVASLEMVAYYEMASRLVQQVRAPIVAGNQVFTPFYAEQFAENKCKVGIAYRKNFEVSFVISIMAIGILAPAAPLVALVWLGERVYFFELTLSVLAFSWTLNSAMAAAYFICIGSGFVGGALASQVVQGFANVLLGAMFAYFFGGLGVVFASAIAVGLGIFPLVFWVRAILRPERAAMSVEWTATTAILGLLAISSAGVSFLFATDLGWRLHGSILAATVCLFVMVVSLRHKEEILERVFV